ncbi:EAL domain-containing protein [Marinobacteraceae bacterium S3BR75-40.1]
MGTILVMLHHEGNQRILKEALPQYALRFFEEGSGLDHDHSLIIVDYNHFRKHREELRRLREQASPVLLPVLLLRERQLGQVNNQIGILVDDVVCTPVLSNELLPRLKNLLRLNELSNRQYLDYLNSQSLLNQVDRAYRTLAECNEAVIHARSEDELFEDVLSSIVSPERYCLAWIGWAREDAERNVEIVAHRGARQTDVEGLIIRWGDDRFGQGPVGRALKEREPVVWNRVQECDDYPPLRDFAVSYGINAVAAFPLELEEGLAVLAMYSVEPDVFGEREIELLYRLARNAAFGLRALRTRRALEEQREQAQHWAYRDRLTSLPNRQHMMDELARLDAEAERHRRYAAVLFVDLDGFKQVNDSQGHVAGDRLLLQVADRLKAVAREEDFVARLGGDEFLVLIQAETAELELADHGEPLKQLTRSTSQLAERIIEHLGAPFQDDGQEYQLGASVGISLFPYDSDRAIDLIDLADMAMYESKTRGGGRYSFYYAQLTADREQRHLLERALRLAVRRGEITTRYQPVINLDTGEVEMIEALMRWERPDGSVRYPAEFLGLLEDTGLIAEAGAMVASQAAATLRRCRKILPDLKLALNLSVSQLWLPRVLDQIRVAREHENLADDAIVIEVSEEAVRQDSERMQRNLRDLQSRGFAVAIDGFGAGYSSLNRLKDLPLALLKLDRSFLDELNEDSRSGELIQSLSDLASVLDLRMVIEGVENEEQWETLKKLRCQLGQGHFFAEPMPEELLLQYLDEGLDRHAQVEEL